MPRSHPSSAATDPAVEVVLQVLRAALGQRLERPRPSDDIALARRVYELSIWHRVAGFLEADAAAQHYLDAADAPPMAARTRAMAALRQLRSLLDALDSEGIPVVPLKGPLLSARLFGDPTLRGCKDLDLLVPENRVGDALRRLSRDYWVPEYADGSRSRTAHHVELGPRNERGFLVELHWGSLSWRHGPRGFDEEMWSSVTRRRDAGLSYLVPDPAVEAVLVASHAAGHLSHRILWLADVAALLVQHGEQTWTRALEIASRWKMRGSTLTGTVMAARLMNVPLPEPLQRSAGVRDHTADWVLSRLRAGITVAVPEPAELIEHWRHRIGLRDGWRARLSTASKLVLSSVESHRKMRRVPWWASPVLLWRSLLRARSIGVRRTS